MKRIFLIFASFCVIGTYPSFAQTKGEPGGDCGNLIYKPFGLPIVSGRTKVLRTSLPLCFEWQYVDKANDVLNYHRSQPIEAYKRPSYTWKVSMGRLENANSRAPIFIPELNMDKKDRLRLPYLDLKYEDCLDTRTLEVYFDHLERDFKNFNKWACGVPDNAKGPGGTDVTHFCWIFEYGEMFWRTERRFNCFGSVWHAYDGSRTSTMELPPFEVVWQDSSPINWGKLSKLAQRGDIISYWDKYGDMQHAATFLDAETTFGANNGPEYAVQTRSCACGEQSNILYQGTSWTWCLCTPKYYLETFNHQYEHFKNIPDLLKTVKLHRRLSG